MHIPRKIKTSKDSLTVFAKEAIVCSDWHVPGESKVWYHKLLEYRRTNDIKTIVIGGDFWNFDSISRWVIKDKKRTLSQELEKGLNILKSLTKDANVYLVCGNHDLRIAVSFGGALSFSEWMHGFDIENLTVTDNDYLHLKSGSATYRICHPDTYSRIKGNVVSKLAHNLQENVMIGHHHFTSLSTNPTGQYVCADLGSMCAKTEFLYKNSATTSFPDWENSFLHIREGRLRLISDYTF